MKRYFSIIAIMALVVCMFAGCGSKKSNTSSNANSGTSSSESAKQEETAVPESTESTDAGSDISSSDDTKQLSGKHHVVIKVKKYGNIKVELDADTAPISVTNFVNLAKKGFYDGLTFHRIIDGFMIQVMHLQMPVHVPWCISSGLLHHPAECYRRSELLLLQRIQHVLHL